MAPLGTTEFSRTRSNDGLTLVEVLLAAAILAMAVGAVLLCYIKCIELIDAAAQLSAATRVVSNQIETIRATPFDQIKTTFHGTSFVPAGLPGRGVVYVDDSDPELLDIVVSVSWRHPRGWVVGEDYDLDGQLDAGEDQNGNGRLDGGYQVEFKIYDKSVS